MRRRSREPIHKTFLLLSQAKACGVVAGEGSRRFSRIRIFAMLNLACSDRHSFHFARLQQGAAIGLNAHHHLFRLAAAEVLVIKRNVLYKITSFVTPFALALAALTAEAITRGIVTFQENAAPPESTQPLVGHWRKTTISYTGPIDEHLVLHGNGTVDNWTR